MAGSTIFALNNQRAMRNTPDLTTTENLKSTTLTTKGHLNRCMTFIGMTSQPYRPKYLARYG